MTGCIYHNSTSDAYVMCLDFRKWATVGCPVKKVSVGDKDPENEK